MTQKQAENTFFQLLRNSQTQNFGSGTWEYFEKNLRKF